MDVDSLNSLVLHIRQTGRDFEQKYSQLSNEVDSSIGSSWVSPSATEFQRNFQGCSKDVRKVLDELEALAMKMQIEIADYEQCAFNLE